jgi:hypothetical protein
MPTFDNVIDMTGRRSANDSGLDTSFADALKQLYEEGVPEPVRLSIDLADAMLERAADIQDHIVRRVYDDPSA